LSAFFMVVALADKAMELVVSVLPFTVAVRVKLPGVNVPELKVGAVAVIESVGGVLVPIYVMSMSPLLPVLARNTLLPNVAISASWILLTEADRAMEAVFVVPPIWRTKSPGFNVDCTSEVGVRLRLKPEMFRLESLEVITSVPPTPYEIV